MMMFNDKMYEPTYDDLRSYIFKNYGYRLNDEELDVVIRWFRQNRSSLYVDNLQDRIIEFLSMAFPDKDIVLMEDDSSNLNYLYSMLSGNIKKK